MKILYIAPFRDFSGYATAARGYLRALHSAGADIVARSVRYDKADLDTEYKPTELEHKLLSSSLDGVKIVMQHLTPNEMRLTEATRDKINIAVVAWETTRIPDYWVKKLNQFDSVITFCDSSVEAFKNSGVTVPVYKIPHCFDIRSYNRSKIEPLKMETQDGFMKDRFIFYNISQFSHKKGLDVLLQAYYAEFWENPEKVALILKTYINMSGDRSHEQEFVANWVKQIRGAMRLPQYPPVIIITQTMSEEKIKRLHATGHCYVCSSRGEGWCVPAFEALAYGNKLVTTRWGGMAEFTNCIKLPNVFQVNFSMQPLVGQQHPDPDLYTARDFVAEPSISSMMEAMRHALNSPLKNKSDLSEFDYSKVGPEMLNILQLCVIDKN